MTIVAGPGLPRGSVPHLKVPFALDESGTAQVVQQSTSQDVVQCVAMLVGTRPGTRMLIPTYGVLDPTFGRIDQKALKLAVQTWESRATVGIAVTPGNEEIVTVQVRGGTP